MIQMNVAAAAEWADGWGFHSEVAFDQVRSIVLPANQSRLSGWYLLRFADDTFYVGESVDLRSRMLGHAGKWGDEIRAVRVLARLASKQELKRVERELTKELEAIGVSLRNVVNASIAVGKHPLDELLAEDEQERWLADPREYNSADRTPLKGMREQEIRYSTAATRYQERPAADAATTLLRTFLEACVPVPRATEFQYWAVSTGTLDDRRCCVNVGGMEVFVLGSKGGFLNVRRSLVASGFRGGGALKLRHPGITVRKRDYRDGAGDVVSLHSNTMAGLRGLLSDERVTRAAAQLVLDVMRKRFCVYTRYHCPQLVQLVYSDFARETAAATVAGDLPDASEPLTETPPPDVEELGDVRCYWIVGRGGVDINDIVRQREWRMAPNPRFEAKVMDMLPGERVAVRTRRNTKDDIPFDHRDNLVSVMDFELTGTIAHNPGDGCSVGVDWDPIPAAPRRYYLYTSGDPIWPVVRGVTTPWDDLIGFAFDGEPQQIDLFRNAPFWAERFGDH